MAGIPTESPLVLRESLRWVPPATTLLQRRTTKRPIYHAEEKGNRSPRPESHCSSRSSWHKETAPLLLANSPSLRQNRICRWGGLPTCPYRALPARLFYSHARKDRLL